MPRFAKGSQEAKDYMASIRNARKQPDYVPPANKKLTKKQREMEELKKVKVDIPVMGKTSLIVPEYFAVPRKGRFGAMKYKLVNPMSQERNLSSRGGEKSLKIIRKPVGDMSLLMEDGSEAPLPLLAFSKADQKLIQGISKMVEANKDKDPADVRPLGRPKPVERGRPEKLPKNIAVHKQRKTKPGWSKKQTKKQQEDDGENIQMTMEEEPAPTTAYQRKQRQTYASEAERKEAVKKQKRDYAQRKRDKLKAEGSGVGGSLAAAELKDLLGASYDPKIDKVGNFELDNQISSGTSKVYYNNNTGQAVVAHRGTAGISDWGNNAVYALGGKTAYKLTPRYKEAKKVQDKAEKKYGKQKVSTIGHSQGGLQAELLGGNSKEIITLNKATRPFESNTNKNQYDVRSKGDLVSGANPFRKKSNNDINIKRQTSNPLTEHSGDILNRLDKDQMIGQGSAVATSFENQLHYRLNDREFLVVEIHQLQRRMDAIMTGGGTMEDRIRRIMELNGQMEQLVNRLTQLNNVIGELQNQLMNNQDEDEGDTESESSIEGEGIAEWIRTKLGVKQGVKPADYRERLDKMITIAKAEQQKAFIDQRRRDKGLPPLKPKPIGRVAPAPVYNDMIFDDSGELVEGRGMKYTKYQVAPAPPPFQPTAYINEELRQTMIEKQALQKHIAELKAQKQNDNRNIARQMAQALRPSGIAKTADKLDTMESLFDPEGKKKRAQAKKLKEQKEKDLAEREAKKNSSSADAKNVMTQLLNAKKSGVSGMGISNYVVQSVIFKKDKYSATEARKWLKDNKYKAPKVDETENMLRFRQMSPSVVDKKGYTEYRTKPLGKSGIELVLAYKGRIQGGSGRPKPDMSGFPDEEDEEEVPPPPPQPPRPPVQAPNEFPDVLIAEILRYLPIRQYARQGADNFQFYLNSEESQRQIIDGLELTLDRLPTTGSIQERARLVKLIASLKRRFENIDPIKKINLQKRDDEGDDEGGFNPPKIQRTAVGNGMRKKLYRG